MGPCPYKPYLKLLIGDCTTPGEKKTCQAKGEGRVAAPLQWNMSVRPCKPWVYIQNWCWCWCCSCCCCCCQNILHSLKSLKSWHDDDMWTMLMLLIIYTQVGHEQKCSPGAAWNPNSQNQVQNSRPISEASERRVAGIHQPNLLYFTYLSSASVCVSLLYRTHQNLTVVGGVSGSRKCRLNPWVVHKLNVKKWLLQSLRCCFFMLLMSTLRKH